MKIIFVLLFAFVFSFAAFAGGNQDTNTSTQQRPVSSRIPQEVRDAIRNAPEDALVGVGTANLRSLSQSRTVSATRARAELSRQMDTFIQDMVRDYTASSEVDHSATVSFQENITVALSRSRLQGAVIVDEVEDERGNYWTIVMLSRQNALNEVNQAVSAAKLSVPAMASFNAEDRMAAAFERFQGTELGFSDRD
ncbi:MAG: hypothetical protein FWD24_04810 [Treponema sp.]|nr:hypothetical protein [Treponema sp.]